MRGLRKIEKGLYELDFPSAEDVERYKESGKYRGFKKGAAWALLFTVPFSLNVLKGPVWGSDKTKEQKTKTTYVKNEKGEIKYRYVPQWDMTIKITPEIERIASIAKKYFKEGKSFTAPPREAMLLIYADTPWVWDPKELPMETIRKVMVRDYDLPKDFRILVIRKIRKIPKSDSEYLKRMGYDPELEYKITVDDGGLGQSYLLFYAHGEWGGVPYFKKKWKESKNIITFQ